MTRYRESERIPLSEVREKYKMVYLVLVNAKKEMLIIKNSKKLTKNKDGFRRGICMIETLIGYMEH